MALINPDVLTEPYKDEIEIKLFAKDIIQTLMDKAIEEAIDKKFNIDYNSNNYNLENPNNILAVEYE